MKSAARRTVKSMPVTSPVAVPQLFRLTVPQYHRMVQTGILKEDAPVELLEGLLVSKMPHNPAHDATVSVIRREIAKLLPDDWIIRVQSAVTLEDSEPEPDLVVAAGPEERYWSAHPRPKEIGLIIEVSDTSLDNDRKKKGVLYAKSGIPVYWIVNLAELQIEVFSQPRGGKKAGYRQRENLSRQQEISLVMEGKKLGSIAIAKLLR